MKMLEKTNGIVPEAQKQIMQKVIMYAWEFETTFSNIQMYEIIYRINFVQIILEHQVERRSFEKLFAMHKCT